MQAKRTFVQIFPKDLLPPHYFEPVMHNGALKWVVLLGNEISIVPTNASELKRCLRFEIDKVSLPRTRGPFGCGVAQPSALPDVCCAV